MFPLEIVLCVQRELCCNNLLRAIREDVLISGKVEGTLKGFELNEDNFRDTLSGFYAPVFSQILSCSTGDDDPRNPTYLGDGISPLSAILHKLFPKAIEQNRDESEKDASTPSDAIIISHLISTRFVHSPVALIGRLSIDKLAPPERKENTENEFANQSIEDAEDKMELSEEVAGEKLEIIFKGLVNEATDRQVIANDDGKDKEEIADTTLAVQPIHYGHYSKCLNRIRATFSIAQFSSILRDEDDEHNMEVVDSNTFTRNKSASASASDIGGERGEMSTERKDLLIWVQGVIEEVTMNGISFKDLAKKYSYYNSTGAEKERESQKMKLEGAVMELIAAGGAVLVPDHNCPVALRGNTSTSSSNNSCDALNLFNAIIVKPEHESLYVIKTGGKEGACPWIKVNGQRNLFVFRALQAKVVGLLTNRPGSNFESISNALPLLSVYQVTILLEIFESSGLILQRTAPLSINLSGPFDEPSMEQSAPIYVLRQF